MSLRPIFFALFLTFICSTTTQAQDYYDNAVGLRLGYPASISYKQFVSDKAAFEAYAGIRGYGFGSFVNVSAAYQVHTPIDNVEGLRWYYGGGAAVFFWNYDDLFLDNNFSTTSIGVQGYLGLDYTFQNAPVNITLDWVPTFFLGGTLNINTFGAGYASLGVRYILGQ